MRQIIKTDKRMKQKQTLIIVVVAVIVAMLLFGSRMFFVIDPGERAVVFNTISGKLSKDDIEGTGLKMIAPWNNLFKYEVKEQSREEPLDILDKSGLSLSLDITIRFNPIYERIGYLHETFGQNYINRLIIPEMRSTVRNVAGRYTAEEIYSTKRNEVETTMITETAAVLKENNIDMRALLIRSIILPDGIKKAIELKLTREQESLAMVYVKEKEEQEADRKRIEAQGVSDYNRILSASLNDKILKQKGIDATLKLAESANAKVVIIGSGKDGMPLILGSN